MAAGESLDKTGTSERRASQSSPHRLDQASKRCPSCGSTKTWKDGLRPVRDGSNVQRYICRECGHRFSPSTMTEPRPESDCKEAENLTESGGEAYINLLSLDPTRRVCASEGVAKNLVAAETAKQETAAGDLQTAEIRTLLFNYAWWLKKQGYAESTIEGWTKILRTLSKRGVDLNDPESVKDGIARQAWSFGRKENAVDAFTSLLGMHGQKWNPPIYKRVAKLPFIPQETEIDQLIAVNGKKVAAFLQLLKETGARSGEAWRLKWIDIDFESRSLNITPEKGSNPRHCRISLRLITMLNELPREGPKIWMASMKSLMRRFQRKRAEAARNTQNPRLMQITFHTLRHWKATTEYAKTKDILHVMQILGHRSIHNTLRYTQLIASHDEDYVAKTAKTVEECCALVEAGFEYVTEIQEQAIKIFRKRK